MEKIFRFVVVTNINPGEKAFNVFSLCVLVCLCFISIEKFEKKLENKTKPKLEKTKDRAHFEIELLLSFFFLKHCYSGQ